jgi:hypothetical protein
VARHRHAETDYFSIRCRNTIAARSRRDGAFHFRRRRDMVQMRKGAILSRKYAKGDTAAQRRGLKNTASVRHLRARAIVVTKYKFGTSTAALHCLIGRSPFPRKTE